MSGWLRYFALNAQARTGFSTAIVIWLAIAAVAAVAAAAFFVFAAFIWLAENYSPLTASLSLALVFVVIALIAIGAYFIVRRRNIARAERELAARSNAAWLDPKVLAMGFQIGQSIGWRRLASLAVVGLLAAGLAKEWFGRDEPRAGGEDAPPEN
jgi:uncharacterized membrane protein YbhN (UPF0104 family)